MSPFKTLLFHLKPHSPLSISQSTHKSSPFFSIYQRFFTSDQPQTQIQTKPTKPLHLLFKEAVELSPKTENPQSEDNPVKKSLRELEEEVRSLKAKKREIETKPDNSKPKLRLHAVFTNTAGPAPLGGGRKRKEVARERSNVVFRDLSEEMEVVLSHLYKEGYLRDATCLFVNGGRLDFECFNSPYGRGFIKFAVERFAKDHQLIAKWLSGSDLKKVALFGCPSLERKGVFGAKRLRNFFCIPENTVCSKCVLKESCKFVNQNVWNGAGKNLSLTDVVNTITLYALDSVPTELVVTDEVKSAVSRLLKEVLKLSQTYS